jgi:hypothetical protein
MSGARSSYGPTYGFATSLEVGLGAFVGTPIWATHTCWVKAGPMWLPIATDDERSTPTQSLAPFGRSAGPRASDTTCPVDEIAQQLQHGT